MDELPSEAQSILSLAKQAQPKAASGTRERVRASVDFALASATNPNTETSKLGPGKSFLTSTKIMLASGMLLFGGAGMLLRGSAPQAASSSPSAPVAVASTKTMVAGSATKPPIGESELLLPEPAPIDERADARAHLRSRAAPPEVSQRRLSLAAEISLLSEATDALAKRDPATARAVLLTHRRRFKSGQLREERDGIWVLIRCMETPDAARAEAAAFVRKSPTSLLAIRVKRDCGLVDGT